MKNNLLKLLFCFCCLPFFFNGKAQEVVQGLKQTIDFTLDDVGNATVVVSMKLNASQWDMFKRNMGGNTSLIKRQMERALPKYYLSDFNYSEAGMDRAYKVTFKALGICTMNRNGVWEAKLDTKNPDITKLSDREFVINEDIMVNGALVQQTQKIHLPSSASNAKVEKDSFGKAVLTYTTGTSLASKALTVLGVLLILGGCWLYYNNLHPKENKLVLAHIKKEEKETQVV